MKCFFILLACFILIGCSSAKKKPEDISGPSAAQQAKERRAVNKFERANEFLDEEKYHKAIVVYNDLLTSPPSTNFENITLYNLGMAYEGIKDCQSAADTFRQLSKSATQNQNRLQALALFRLSYAYECLGQDAKVVSSLLDVLRRKKYLPQEVSMAEAPARLAGAYARIGNRKMAEKYFKIAERGANVVGTFRKNRSKRQEIMARTLFLMGNVDPGRFAPRESLKYLYNLEYTQRYLLRSVEFDHDKWSVRSADMLLASYDQVWKLLGKLDRMNVQGNTVIKKREHKIMKEKVVRTAINNIQLLKRERFPESSENKLLESVLYQIVVKEKKFQTYLANNFVSLPVTKENEPRFGGKRKGRLVDPKKK